MLSFVVLISPYLSLIPAEQKFFSKSTKKKQNGKTKNRRGRSERMQIPFLGPHPHHYQSVGIILYSHFLHQQLFRSFKYSKVCIQPSEVYLNAFFGCTRAQASGRWVKLRCKRTHDSSQPLKNNVLKIKPSHIYYVAIIIETRAECIDYHLSKKRKSFKTRKRFA